MIEIEGPMLFTLKPLLDSIRVMSTRSIEVLLFIYSQRIASPVFRKFSRKCSLKYSQNHTKQNIITLVAFDHRVTQSLLMLQFLQKNKLSCCQFRS